MTLRRLPLLVLFACLAATALFVARSDAKPETVEQIVPGVWFREGDLKNLGHCNNIIIEMKDYLVVVDANFPSGARAALEDSRRLSSKPVKYVFDTHHHGDHAYGNAVWTQNGATTLAAQGVAEEMKRYEPKRWLASAKERKDVGELNLPTAEPPKQTFPKTFQLKDDTREIQFHFLGWAHTRGDGFVYLPKERILCTGDAVVNGPYNYTADAHIANWPKVVAAAQKRFQVQRVLPGHGVPGGPEVLDGQGRFMTALHKAVKDAIGAGKKLEDLVKMDGPKLVSTSVTLPDDVRNWVGPSLPAQVKDAYEEITQRKPHGDMPH